MSTASNEDAELDRLLRRAAQEPVRYPPGLVDRSLDMVRGIRGYSTDDAIDIPQDGGRLRVARGAVVTLVHRLAAELCAELGGLHVRSVHFVEQDVLVSVNIGYGTPVRQSDLLRDALREGLTGYLGAQAPPVRVHLADAYDPYG